MTSVKSGCPTRNPTTDPETYELAERPPNRIRWSRWRPNRSPGQRPAHHVEITFPHGVPIERSTHDDTWCRPTSSFGGSDALSDINGRHEPDGALSVTARVWALRVKRGDADLCAGGDARGRRSVHTFGRARRVGRVAGWGEQRPRIERASCRIVGAFATVCGPQLLVLGDRRARRCLSCVGGPVGERTGGSNGPVSTGSPRCGSTVVGR
jgi:hypothetical protein